MVVMLFIIDYIHTRECEEILMKNWLLNCEIQFVKFNLSNFSSGQKKEEDLSAQVTAVFLGQDLGQGPLAGA